MFQGTFETENDTCSACWFPHPPRPPSDSFSYPTAKGIQEGTVQQGAPGNMCLHPLQGVHTTQPMCSCSRQKKPQHCAYHCRSALWPNLSLNLVRAHITNWGKEVTPVILKLTYKAQQFQHFLNNDFVIPRDQYVALPWAKCFLKNTHLQWEHPASWTDCDLQNGKPRGPLCSLRLWEAELTMRTSDPTPIFPGAVTRLWASQWQSWVKNSQVLLHHPESWFRSREEHSQPERVDLEETSWL